LPDQIGQYRILHKIGEGGMGVVYSAHDPRLDRRVAIKVIREAATDEQARRRFWREARAAAGVSHPNICQIYEVGEQDGAPYLVMELLEGESLAERLRRGRLPLEEAVAVMLGVLAALEALHRRELVHRDLKPSNVFLTPHGPKLLDFGLARTWQVGPDAATLGDLTQPGTILGTPRYMSPEQLQAQTVGPPSDLFAAGALLFEMLTGRYAFAGDTLMAVFHAVVYDPPPALPEVPAVNALLQRAMARQPADRYPSAQAMSDQLRAAGGQTGSVVREPEARRQTRLIVLPFRLLRPDAEAEFLAFSLPDAITTSLSGLVESLIVRSSLVATRFAGPAPDLAALASEAQVDAVLTGTLLRAGDQLRVSTQLVETPGGAVLWSQTSQVAWQDIFQLQDALVQRIVGSLAGPLTTRQHRLLRHDVPGSAEAYEYYLRANQASVDMSQTAVARDLYLQCVTLDPRYAPAWARLGRCHWVIAKWSAGGGESDLARAEEAFQRALSLHPDLPLTHHLYARLEADTGRAAQAMTRLLQRARANPNDAELYAGLVHACRYCGLLEASLAAYEKARRLDPQIPTSVEHTLFVKAEYERVLRDVAHAYNRAQALVMLGRREEALAVLQKIDVLQFPEFIRLYGVSFLALVEGKAQESIDAAERLLGLKYHDLEGTYYLARQFAYLGQPDRALKLLESVIERGYCCWYSLGHDPWLESVRSAAGFQAVYGAAEQRYRAAQESFRAAGGEEILGASSAE
jgi:serine/threonine protein kinase/Flp pilus assembly protein TadD